MPPSQLATTRPDSVIYRDTSTVLEAGESKNIKAEGKYVLLCDKDVSHVTGVTWRPKGLDACIGIKQETVTPPGDGTGGTGGS